MTPPDDHPVTAETCRARHTSTNWALGLLAVLHAALLAAVLGGMVQTANAAAHVEAMGANVHALRADIQDIRQEMRRD